MVCVSSQPQIAEEDYAEPEDVQAASCASIDWLWPPGPWCLSHRIGVGTVGRLREADLIQWSRYNTIRFSGTSEKPLKLLKL